MRCRCRRAAEPPKPTDPVAGAQKLVVRQQDVKAALNGVWQRVEGQPGGSPKGAGPGFQRWTFDGDFVTTETKLDEKDVRTAQFRYHLHPLRSPAEITLHGETGLLQGIYTLDGDVLTVAIGGLAELERPKGFTRADAGLLGPLVVLTLKRVRAKGDPAAVWGERAVAALLTADRSALPTLATEFRELPAGARRAMPLAVREDAVEFTFCGQVPLGDGVGFVEYLIAGEDKGYEALLVAAEGERKRLRAVAPFFTAHDRAGRRQWWQARLLWVEDGQPRSADLGDLFGHSRRRGGRSSWAGWKSTRWGTSAVNTRPGRTWRATRRHCPARPARPPSSLP